jgi:hypothetical protein
MPSDKSYQETKQIKLGKATIKQEFRELAGWIDKTYNVHTLNILYDDSGKHPVLEICLEFKHEKVKFADENSEKQYAIAKQFKQTTHGAKLARDYFIADIWVTYSVFETVAKWEANTNVSNENIDELKKTINNSDIWEISRRYEGVTFFLFTDEQLEKYKDSKFKKEWADKYFAILETCDEFGYFKREDFSIYLDSKENFDKNYKSNWYWYYK